MPPIAPPDRAGPEPTDRLPTDGRRTTTILFSDLVGFTGIAEGLDPETVRAVQQRYFATARAAIERHGGTVEKYIGDAVMAVFGVPAVREDDALRAVRAALDLDAAVSELGRSIPALGGRGLAVRSGVNTGEVATTGDPTSGVLVTGDAVNVAARLQQAAAPGTIVASATTHALVRHAVEVEPIGGIEVKGRVAAVEAVRVIRVLPHAEAVARRPDSPFVGRVSELAQLQATLERVTADRSVGAATIIGAPGVGKSRLVHEFLVRPRQRGRVLRGRCLPYGDGITWWPLVEAIHAAADIAATDDAATVRSKLHGLVGEVDHGDLIERRIATLVGVLDEPAPAQELAWAVRRLLEELSDGPLILVLDDIQWAEAPLLDLVEHLADRLTASPVMLVCIARPELTETRPGWLDGRPFHERIRAEPLGEAAISLLLDGLLENLALPDEPRSRIVEAAEGNPLYLEQMLAMLVDDGYLRIGPDGWRVERDLTSVPIPPTIGALLGARLERLSSDERATIERAAVVGKVFWWGSVVELTPASEQPAVGGHLATLVRREFIRPDPVGPDATIFPGDEAFRFRHLLVRDAAYVRLSKASRADLHERFATWLETRTEGVEYGAIIGYHLEQAVGYRRQLALDPEQVAPLRLRAAAHLGRAGSAAIERGETGPAISLLGRAVDLWPADAPGRLTHIWDLAIALTHAGRVADSQTRLDQLLAAATTAGDEAWVWRTRLRLANRALMRGEPDSAATFDRIARDALEASRERNDPGLGAQALESLGMLAIQRGEVSVEDVALREALDLAAQAGDRLRVNSIRFKLVNRAPAGYRPVPDGIAIVRAVLDAPGTGLQLRADALVALGMLCVFGDRLAEARRTLAESRRIADDLGLVMPTLAADWPWAASLAERWGGNVALAERYLREAVELERSMNDLWHLAAMAPNLAECILLQPELLDAARRSEARALIEEGRQATLPEDLVGEGGWKFVLARLESAEGRHGLALDLARSANAALDQTEEIWSSAEARLVLASVARAAGDEELARGAALEAIELARRKGARLYERVAREFLAG